ncbi:MAG: B12-binding domain-containing radical SAM protein [Deltaproteobacteria bacterium]|nr:B12-binding domain-containing radical SAM protein [Deltaproteobacteria bacterium]
MSMRICLVNVTDTMSSDGSRLIAALLKREGHSVKTVFFAKGDYTAQQIAQLDSVLERVDLVMVAVYSLFAQRAVQVTRFVRERYPGLKVVWGGPHCISAPDLSLRHADGVCFAEGDRAVVELVRKMEAGEDYTDVPNMSFMIDGRKRTNAALPPSEDLDRLPFPDHELEDQFVLGDRLVPVTEDVLREHYTEYLSKSPTYFVLTSLGCPHSCSYCNNVRYELLHGKTKIRFRSIENVILELEHVLPKFPFFESISFGDDDFLTRSEENIRQFAAEYKKRIGLPFFVTFSANTFTKKKLDILLEAGLRQVQMGVQSGSQRVLEAVFNRKIKLEKTKEVVRQLTPYLEEGKLRLWLDFIVDNPYETPDDVLATYQYLIQLPPTANVRLFKLQFFPGTPLYERAVADGYIEPYQERPLLGFGSNEIEYQLNYPMLLLAFYGLLTRREIANRVPRRLLAFLGCRTMHWAGALLPSSAYRGLILAARRAVRALRTTRAALRGRMADGERKVRSVPAPAPIR